MKLSNIRRGQAGFTLVEMSIVLIIIGIILGAVINGRDMIRSAEQKKIYTTFVNEWRNAYLSYYDRTGTVLGDTYDGAAAGRDGRADSSAGTGTTATAAGRTQNVTDLTAVGLNPPKSNATNEFEYIYTDADGGQHTLVIDFQFTTANVMNIGGITNELAIVMDTIIDGSMDAAAGQFIEIGTGDGTWIPTPAAPTTITTAQWTLNF